jgi:uncharacterized protein
MSETAIPIREIGTYFEKDSEGYLINPAAPEKIQEEWRPIVKDIVEAYKTHYGESLDAVYVRGSVGKGEAVAGISDVDTFAYVNLPKEEIKTDWMKKTEEELLEKYKFVQGVELSADPTEVTKDDVLFIRQSACVYGNDLNNVLPKIKVGKDTLGHVYWFGEDMKKFDEWISTPQDSENIRSKCTWLMKRFLRTGIELTMERAGLYTRDLYPCYKVFAEYYPDKESEMKEALYFAINPAADVEVLKRIRNNLGSWMEEQVKNYKN